MELLQILITKRRKQVHTIRICQLFRDRKRQVISINGKENYYINGVRLEIKLIDLQLVR